MDQELYSAQSERMTSHALSGLAGSRRTLHAAASRREKNWWVTWYFTQTDRQVMIYFVGDVGAAITSGRTANKDETERR